MPLVILVNKFRKHCYKLQTFSWRTEHWNVSMTNQHLEKEGKVKFIFWFSFHSNIPNVSRFKKTHLLKVHTIFYLRYYHLIWSAAAAKSPQSRPTLCNHIGGSPPGSPIPGILQARTLEWVAISFSNAWKWKVKVKSLSCVWLLATPRTAATRLLRPWDFPGKSTGVGCHCRLQTEHEVVSNGNACSTYLAIELCSSNA